jgi:hypothetical protein
VGALLGCVAAAMGLTAWLRQGGAKALTEESLTAARARWQAANIQNYDLEIDIRGRQPGKVVLQVRRGEVTSMTRDGVTPSRRETWDVWSVPGMFDTIEEEWSKRTDTSQGFGAQGGGALLQRAKFDPDNGLPRYYSRSISGSPLDVTWEVTQFRSVTE